MNQGLVRAYGPLPRGLYARSGPRSSYTFPINEDTATTGGTVLTAPGSANVKGAWVAVGSPLPRPIDSLLIHFSLGTTQADALVDIGVGSSITNVTPLIENLKADRGSVGVGGGVHGAMPCVLPAGAQLFARYQATATTMTNSILLHGSRSYPPLTFSGVETVGAVLTDSGGTGIDPGGSANTKGAWVTVGMNTRPWRRLWVGLGNQVNTTRTSAGFYVYLNTTRSTSDYILAAARFIMSPDTDSPIPFYLGPFDIRIPAGSSLNVQAQSSITDATDRLFDVILYGAY